MNPFDADGWRERAACKGLDPNLWVPNTRGEGQPLYEPARAVCTTCPVRQPCLDYALANHEEHGMWGGLTPTERAELGYVVTRRQCRVCGVQFLPASRNDQRYCSDDCRSERRRRNRRPA